MKRNGKTFSLTLGAVLAALSLALLYVGSLLPSGQLALTAAAGLWPAAAVISVGLGGGFGVWAVTALLGLLVVPNKMSALLYAGFFGLYPMVKSGLERLRNKVFSWALKFLFFDLVLCVFVFGFGTAFMPLLPAMARKHTALALLAGNVVFTLYDLGFSQVIGFYLARIEPAIRRNGKTN